jgi:hypothetical protein
LNVAGVSPRKVSTALRVEQQIVEAPEVMSNEESTSMLETAKKTASRSVRATINESGEESMTNYLKSMGNHDLL